jgi:hypothetical protein
MLSPLLDPLSPNFTGLFSKAIPLPFRLADHDIQLYNALLASLQINLPLDLKAHLPINDRVDSVAALQVAGMAVPISEIGDVIDELSSVAFAASSGTGPNVNQVPGILVAGAEHADFGVVEEGQKFGEETFLAFGAELIVQAPHAAAADCQDVVHVISRWHPV